jgi:hypothetical protein
VKTGAGASCENDAFAGFHRDGRWKIGVRSWEKITDQKSRNIITIRDQMLPNTEAISRTPAWVFQLTERHSAVEWFGLF